MTDDRSVPPATSRRLASSLVVLFAILVVLRLVLAVSTGSLTDQSGLLVDLLVDVTALVFPSLFVAVGWLIVTRQPGNTIGWILLAIPLLASFLFFCGDYATEALVTRPGSLPFGSVVAWLDRWLIVAMMASFIPLFLLFPDGHIPSRRWRPVLWLTIAAPVITIVGFAVTPGRMTGAFADLQHVRVMNPFGIDALAGVIGGITQAGGFLTFGAAVLAGVAIVVRFRGSSGEVRQQIRWLALVAVALLAEILVGFALAGLTGDNDTVGNAVFIVWFITLVGGIPLACGIAILRYHLYDLDLVVRKALVFGLLALFVSGVYVALVGGVGALVGARSDTTLSFVAAALLALAFQPARDRARRIADRLVYGERATPYEVLAEFSGRVGETYASEDVLPRMAETLAKGTGASSASVWLRVGDDVRPVVTYPDGTEPKQEHTVEVVHQGEPLGELSVAMPPSDPMNPAKDKLIRDLAAQAGLVLRNVRLIEELRASRQRLVAAQDDERRRIERDLHDGVQQQLVALNVQLGLLGKIAGSDPSKVTALATSLQSRATDALEDLRDLARGIYPPLLADQGLAAALRAQARKAAVPVRLDADGVGRFPHDVEATVYFCTLEALNNVAKYADASQASVRLTCREHELGFEVSDDGRGFDPGTTAYGTGLQGMADRLAVVGGTLIVRSAAGRGTTVTGTVPVDRTGLADET